MLWLPALVTKPDVAPRAVADASAAALEISLLDQASAADHLLRALLADPWFCRWAYEGKTEAQTIAGLAASLATELPDRLVGLSKSPPCWTRPSLNEAQSLGAQAESILDEANELSLTGTQPATSSDYFLVMQSAQPDEATPLVVSDYLAEIPGLDWRLPRLIELVATRGPDANALEQSKLDAMKELAYGASHEINNPLANISGRAQSLLRDEVDPQRRKLLKAINNQAMRAHEMISDLMLFARPPALEKQRLEIGEVISQAFAELTETATRQRIELKQHSAVTVFVNADATQLLVALQALIQNSIDVIGLEGTVTIDLNLNNRMGEIRVVDNGPGISEHVREHLFDPFYSGREAGRGLGFGLSKCWRIVGMHGGSLELESTSDSGSVFLIRLPLADQEP